MKRCKVCKIDKKMEDFPARKQNKDGRARQCRSCHKIKIERPPLLNDRNEKWCIGCWKYIDLNYFAIDRHNKRDGRVSNCLDCEPVIEKETGHKICRICKIEKDMDHFAYSVDHKSKRRSECNECRALQKQIWRLKKNYNLTMDDLNKIIQKQKGLCLVCKKCPDILVVDHNHNCCPTERTCGKCIRGLLCNNCNTAIGLLKDDPEIALAAAAYLKSFIP